MSTMISSAAFPFGAPPTYLESRKTPWRKWTPKALFHLALYLGVCAAASILVAGRIDEAGLSTLVGVFGLLATWRYGWWLTHLVRGKIYQNLKYPRMAREADACWDDGWRPDRMHFLLTVYKEEEETLEAVLRAICAELRREGLKGSIWLGSKTPEDEAMVEEYLQLIAADLPLELRIVRQSASGKRNAIADILKCMAREGLGQNHFVAFMDSDFILFPGALRRALPLFARDPELHAVTTDEECVVKGPQWIRSWLNMRFAQRRIGMMSHALSDRVLTLTGRFSIFRTTHILEPDFIETVQNDRLRHWLWGEFKFLSGDDKSTWYALLRLGVRMAYVPDATGYTLESIEGSGVKRMTENLLRWSGNMLRNGARAIALGPRRMPFFIWWCLVDQRLAMWTMLFGPAAAIVGTFAYGPWFLVSFLIYVALTRLMMSIILWSHSSSVDFNYVWCLYANQLLNAAVKIFVLWRLPRQRWMNRGDQRAGFAGGGVAATLRQGMAGYLTVLSVGFLLFAAFLAVSSTGVTATTLRMMLNL